MAVAKVCVCLVLCTVISISGETTVTIKGLYCKDPDDSTYHPVNSTWRSSTFCGNYTCKIRKKNETLPLGETNVLTNPINDADIDQMNAGSEHYSIKEKKSEQSINRNETNRNNIEISHHFTNSERNINDLKKYDVIKRFEDNIIASLGEKGDRYLNAEEISTITDLLHTVKKSDLEAILEVYTLAKDIFNEIDETAIDKLVDKDYEKIRPLDREFRKIRYFYDPYAMTNEHNKAQHDSKGGTSNKVNAVLPSPMYNGPFLKHYNEKLLEHYPTSDFHRTSSYYYPYMPVPPQAVLPTNTAQKPEPKQNGSCCPANIFNPFVASYITERKSKPQFIPYPLTYILKNSVATYPYDTNPWSQPYMNPLAFPPSHSYGPGLYSRSQNQPRPVSKPQTDILEEIYGTPQKSKLIEKLIPPIDTSKPSWQTGQLSPEIIEDVRANVLQKTEKILNIIPRKKIKLERVAKVLKIDELARSKRDLEETSEEFKKDDKEPLPEEYEVYIEKSTCGPAVEPGYFRVGNMSQPYPLCCPQKIEKR